MEPDEPFAIERFTLSQVARAADRILNICLLGRSQVGSELLGEHKKVEARLVRMDSPGARFWRYRHSSRLATDIGDPTAIGLNATKPVIEGALRSASHRFRLDSDSSDDS